MGRQSHGHTNIPIAGSKEISLLPHMNHLCGVISNGPQTGDCDDEKTAACLALLRERFESDLARIELTSGNCDATYEIAYTELPESGIRPVDDVTLRRFLLADRNHRTNAFDVDASYTRLIDALKFRKEYKCDEVVSNLSSNITPDKVRECRKLRVACWAGLDHESRPVVFERLGQFFSSGNANKVEMDDWIVHYLYFLETHFKKMRESSKKMDGKVVCRIVYFADFQGVVSSILSRNIWKVVPLLKTLVSAVEQHYPELVDHIVLFNVPRIASAAFNVVKAFLHPTTSQKIELFAGVPLERMRELVPASVIPIEYGGTNSEIDYPQTETAK